MGTRPHVPQWIFFNNDQRGAAVHDAAALAAQARRRDIAVTRTP